MAMKNYRVDLVEFVQKTVKMTSFTDLVPRQRMSNERNR